ncbi:MAG: cytochrome C oxidase subunit IV family protein [Proteobacteria bacterium]|nr:cytochrome C oxidase subunit IV family protein [Pseudomonadota bacterium]
MNHALAGRRRGTWTWLALLGATGFAWWLGGESVRARSAVPLLLALAVAKGVLVVREFMELRAAPARWQLLLVGWLVLVAALIGVAYYSGVR